MAKVQPLEGKYYGTVVELVDEKEITVWVMDDYVWCTPSHRQLERWGMTLEEAISEDMMADSHFESERGYKIARIIAHILTEIGE